METVSEKLDRISRRGYPNNASVEVTSRCNARCGYCYLPDESHSDLSTDRLCCAIEKLSLGGVFHLHVTGGEPFIRPDILKVLSYAFDHGIFHCTLFSNGILLTREHADFLVRNKELFRYIQFSVFSHEPEVNDAYFGVPGALEAIMRNVLYLKDNGVRVNIGATVLDFNVDKIDDMHGYFERLGLPFQLAYFKIITGPRTREHLAQSITYSFFKRYLLGLRPAELSGFKRQLKASLETPPEKNASLCFGRWNSIFMNSQGDLAPCISFRKMTYGNIFEERPLNEILMDARDYHTVCAMKKDDVEKCITCKFFNFCTICLGSNHTGSSSLCTTDEQLCHFAQALYDITCCG